MGKIRMQWRRMKKADAVCWMLDAASCMLNVES